MLAIAPETSTDDADSDALGDEIAAIAVRMTATLGRWLELVGRFDASGGWHRWGAVSCADWLAWRCSLSPVTAREHVRIARRLRDLPLIAGALRRGDLSYSKVRALTRIEHISDEAEVLQLARHASASQLDRFVRLARRVTRGEAAAAVEDRHVDVMFDDDGTAIIRARVPAEDGALLLRALGHVDALLAAGESASAAPPEAPEAPATVVRPLSPARRADALAWMADRALRDTGAAGVERASSGDHREVLVHVDVALLTGDDPETADARCDVDQAAPVAAETARRLCCDGGIVTVVRDGDRTVAVGRRTRAIPPAIRRALRARRPCCAFPGCTRTRWLDAHHLVHWAHGGRTDLDNLVHLCRHHHRLVHEGGWQVTMGGDGRCRAQAPNGRLLMDLAAPPIASAPPEDDTLRTEIASPDALAPLSAGQRYDLDLTIDALVAWTTPPAQDTMEVPLAA